MDRRLGYFARPKREVIETERGISVDMEKEPESYCVVRHYISGGLRTTQFVAEVFKQNSGTIEDARDTAEYIAKCLADREKPA